jgi:hypothetical protein
MSETSDRRCVATNGRGERCRKWAIKGATVCLAHGGAIGRVRAKAEQRIQEQRALAVAKRTTVGLDLSQYSDPIRALEFCVGYSHVLARRLAGLVDEIPDGELRYQGKTGEQLRGEVAAAQRALSDLRAAATDTLRLNLDARQAGIKAQTADMLERQIDAAST